MTTATEAARWADESTKLFALMDEIGMSEAERAAMMNGFSIGWDAAKGRL